ncbi:MAG TPA: ABC transporter permease [Gemmatimonadaceae bacterium]|nr:ABC transporter permease [Gemmatimonadaceae bacterium]
MSTLLSDLRYALRVIRMQPGPSIVVGLTLALGLGINAMVFGMMDGLLLRPYPFRDYQRLVVLWDTPEGGSDRDAVAPANFLDWRRQAERVGGLVAWEDWSVTLTDRGEPERVRGFRVSPGFFELIGVAPTIGRPFTPDEEQPGNDRRVVISDGFWKRRFGSNPSVVGTQLLFDGVAYTVVGVAPPSLQFPMASDVWAPLAFPPARGADRTSRTLTVMGKLADGASLSDARAEMRVIARRLEQLYPEANRGRSVSIRTLSTAFVEGAAFVGILQAGAGLVLLAACFNLAGVLLARSMDRRRELAVRIALGASPMRVVRQLVTETVVLSLLASGVAIVCAYAGLGVLRSSVPAEVARHIEGWNNVRLGGALVLLIPVLAIAVGLLVALFPALAASRSTSPASLREGDRGTVGSASALRGRHALVVAEIAFALALLIAAGLTVQSGSRLVNQPGGFDARRLLMLEVTLPEQRYRGPDERRQFVSALTARLEAIPGVERAAVANILPAAGWSPEAASLVEDDLVRQNAGQDVLKDATRWPRAGYRSVSPDFFTAMRIPVVAGREFSTLDREGGRPVAIVSASFAKRFWPGRDAVGERLRLSEPARDWVTVVGVAGDVAMYNWWDGIDYLAVYVPLRQAPPSGVLHAVVRTRGEPASVTGAVREAFREVDPALPLDRARTMQQAIAESTLGLRYLATLMAICGGIALFLAIIGIYALMAYTFAQRTHEFGVRLALGGTVSDIMRLTLRRAAALTAAGIGIGVPIAWMLGRAMAGALRGVVSADATTFVVVAAALAVVSLLSAYLPARRALRLDPAAVLRR